MKSRARVLLVLVIIAVLPLLPGPAEPGGTSAREPQMQQQKLQQQKIQPQQKEIPKSLTSAQTDVNNMVGLLGKTRTDMTASLKKQQAERNNAKEHIVAALKLTQAPGADAGKLEAIRKSLDSAMKSLEAQDKLGNFEIQDLMSRYNQAETLASSVRKKLDETANAVIGKI